MSPLENLLQQCTVKLTIPGGWGTGFFVAPEWILTCAHVVQKAEGEPIPVRWQNQENWAQAVVERSLTDPYDLALLRVTLPTDAEPPCVYLDATIQPRDPLYLFGYPDQDFPNGCPVTFSYEGLTGDEPALIKFASGQVRPGMSGAPLLNQRAGKVCGIVKFTRDLSFDLGGGAIPTSVILDQFPELVEQQRSFHQRDQRWNDLVAKLLFNNEADELMRQTNLDGTNYQTQVGSNSNNFIGGEHHHHREALQEKPKVKKILMLSANPENPETRRRKQETKEIRNALKRATQGALYELHDRLDINAAELSQELTTIEPYIINISGHENGIEGLILEGNLGITTCKTPEKLIADLFKFHAKSVQCIILNGCYSDVQAKQIVWHIEFLICINQDLEDSNVLKFLTNFYYYLGSEQTIRASYNRSCNDLQRAGLDDAQLPILLNKDDEEERRRLEKELSDCDKDIEKHQNNVELWKKKASLLTELGRAEEANEAFEKASSLAPNDYKIRTEQGDALEQLEKYEKAVNAYDKALELETEDYKVWWKKGQALVEGEKYSEAVESYDKAVALAVKLKPHSPDRYIICREYASLLEKLGEYQKSIALYKKSLGFEPRYRASSYLKRQVYKKVYSGRG